MFICKSEYILSANRADVFVFNEVNTEQYEIKPGGGGECKERVRQGFYAGS